MNALNVLHQSKETRDVLSGIPHTSLVENSRGLHAVGPSILGDELGELSRETIRQTFEKGTRVGP